MALSGWDSTKKKGVFIDNTVVDAGLTNFPVLINLGESVGITSYDMLEVFTELPYGIDKYTKLLLESNTFNGSTIFTDSSINPKTITAVNDAQHSTTQSKFDDSSIYFDGTGDSLSVPDSNDWDFGTDNFCIDCWVYVSAIGTFGEGICGCLDGSNNGWGLGILGSSYGTVGRVAVLVDGNWRATTTGTVPLDTWTHIALVGNNGTYKIYINGVSTGTPITEAVNNTSSGAVSIGNIRSTPDSNWDFTGYIDELRISKGISRWIVPFTPPTTVYSINTRIALEIGITGVECSIEIENWIGSVMYNIYYPSTIGTTTVKATTYYSTSYYPHFGVDPTLPLIGTHNSNQWLSQTGINTNQKLNVDLGTAVIVKRFYLENGHATGTASTMGIKNFLVYGTDSSTAFDNTTYADTTSLTLLGTFLADEHVASDVSDPQYFDLSSNSTAYRYYVLRIADNYGFTYMGVRHIEFQHFIEPNAQLHAKVPSVASDDLTVLYLYYDPAHANNNITAINTNTTLLIESNDTGAGTTFIDQSASAHVITTVNNVVHSKTEKIYSKSAIYFDGVADYLTIPTSTDFNFGTDVFTISFWARPASVTTTDTMLYRASYGTYGGWMIRINNGTIQFFSASGTIASWFILTSSAVTINEWIYITVTRDASDDTRLFIDGVLEDSAINADDIYKTYTFYIGRSATYAGNDYEGYLQGIQIIKGECLYDTDSTFTPPDRLPTCGYAGVTGSLPAMRAWDDNFLLVQHMSQNPSGDTPQILNSTNNDIDGTSVGTMTSDDLVDGAIGDAIEFDGTDDYISNGDVAIIDALTAATVEAYFDPTTFTASAGIISKNEGTANFAGFMLDEDSTTTGDYRFYVGHDGAGSATSATETGTALAPVFLVGTVDATNLTLWLDGTKGTPVSTNANYSLDGSTGILAIGTLSHSLTSVVDGIIDEIRMSDVVRSDAWIKATYNSSIDNIITFSAATGGLLAINNQLYSLTTLIDTILNQDYAITFELLAILEQEYGLKLAGISVQEYWILYELLTISQQIYGLRLLNISNQDYSSTPIIASILEQYYNNAYTPMGINEQEFGSASIRKAFWEQYYNIVPELMNILEYNYAITQEELMGISEHVYNTELNNLLVAKSTQQYQLIGDGTQTVSTTTVKVEGVDLKYKHINIEGSMDQFCLSLDLQVVSLEDYLLCDVMSEIIVTISGTPYTFFIEHRGRTRRHGEAIYNISALSHTAKLDVPYADLLTGDIGNASAKAIVTTLASPYTVDWQVKLGDSVIDWVISTKTFYANNESPMALIKRLASSVGAVIQTSPDNVLTVMNDYPTAVRDWNTNTPDLVLSDGADFLSTGDAFDGRPGYNMFIISDQLISDRTVTIEERIISATQKELHVYVTPWEEDLVLTMKTSGGDWVVIPDEDGDIVTERAPYDADDPSAIEIVEFINGEGKLSKPYYERLPLTEDWKETDLGALTFNEDGTIKTSIEGQSLLGIAWITRYHKWIVTDPKIEEVQFYVESADG